MFQIGLHPLEERCQTFVGHGVENLGVPNGLLGAVRQVKVSLPTDFGLVC